MSKKQIGSTGLVQHSDKFEGIYRGKVMDNLDPDQLGRVKVKVYPMLEGVETDLLPWAIPATPVWEGAGYDNNGYSGYSSYSGYSGFGSFAIPKIGTFVYIFFEMGDIYQPVYFAEAPTSTYGIPKNKNGLSGYSNYPNVKVSRTITGLEHLIDSTPGQELIKITTPKGIEILVDDKNSLIQTKSSNDFHFKIDEINEYIEMKTANNITFKLNDNTNEVTITHPSGAYLTLDSSGNWFIKGTTIQLNPV